MNSKNNNHPATNHYQDEERPIDTREIISKFLRRKRLFFYIAVPIFLGIIIAQLVRPYNPIYRATFDLGIANERPVEGFFSGLQEAPTTQIGTVTQRVIANLLSVRLAEKVADTLRLYSYLSNGDHRVQIDARIKQEFKKPIGPMKLHVGKDSFSLYNEGEKIGEGALDEYVDLGWFDLRISRQDKNTGRRTYELTIFPRERMALALRNSLSIKVLEADKIDKEIGSSGVPFSGEGQSEKLVTAKSIFPGMNLIGVLRINVHWGNPDDALKIAQVLSDKIIEEDRSEKSLQFVQSRIFINDQLNQYQEKLNHLEEEIRLFKGRKKIADLKASTQALITQISQLESQKSQKQIEEKMLTDLGHYLSGEEGSRDQTPNFASSLVSDPVLQAFYAQLLQTEAELRGKLKEYSTEHPKVMELRAKLGGLKEQMKEEISKRIPSIGSEIQSIDTQIRLLQFKLEGVPDDEISLARLERDRETAEKLYTFFAEKLEETRVQEAGVTSDLKIINPPMVSAQPVNSRRTLLSIFLALVISIMAGGFSVFIAEYIDNTVKDPNLISARTGIPIFASIPAIEANSNKSKDEKTDLLNRIKERVLQIVEFKKAEDSPPLRILDQDISSAEFEAFRKLAVNIDFADPSKKYKIIYVTSTGPDEGKTFISMNLAWVFRASNKKVLLIDTDFRKKKERVTDVARMKKDKGLFDVLKGEVKVTEVTTSFNPNGQIDKIDEPRSKGSKAHGDNLSYDLDILPVGKIPANPFAYLDSDKMKSLISDLKETYDYIIIDGVPLLLFADATYLATFADGVLLVARYGKTGFRELEYAKDMLISAQSDIVGIVMNSVPRTREGYYYYYHYYYHKYYPRYYKKEENK